MGPLDDRRILITGASAGIGAAVAQRAVHDGARVALVARNPEPLEALTRELGAAAVAVPGDVADAASIAAAVEQAADALGGLDGLVNSAGVARPDRIADARPADWQLTFDVNVIGLLQATQAALPHLRAAAASTPDGAAGTPGVADVVNLSSMSGRRRPSIEMTVYSASKFAVHLLSDGLREELAEDGVRVSVIAPGFVRTAIFDADEPGATMRRYRERMEATGLDATTIADQVAYALAQPPGVSVHEIASMSMRQPR
jgi:NADP-dependent 3-hydroxy acid dehydrogenase YdfG